MDKIKAQFGTAPVFFTAISTILGAVMFLRFGYAVGNLGFFGTVAIILIGHIVTISTAMAIAEIATNQKVEGGGAYYIISRSFGLNIGAAIGVALYLSQAISVAFYIIALVEAFEPVIKYMANEHGLYLIDKRFISVPILIALCALIFYKGAGIGMKALYIVCAILGLSLLLFFLGNTEYAEGYEFARLADTVDDGHSFFTVFAIIFPAFTGMAAGVGLSGDLKNPSKSIPLGTIAATLAGMVIYVLIAFKLSANASPEDLATDQLIMSEISLWGPIIPIGLAAATFSSALGSIIVAPRTLQAISLDRIMPSRKVNVMLSMGKGESNEPVNATLVTSVIALFFVLIGDVDFVAEIISMFFMVTYGAICLISFLEHLSADPSYRPVFRSKWYLSLTGAVMCIWLMFKMNAGYALLSCLIMVGLYAWISYSKRDKKNVESIFQGGIFQISRKIQVFLQKSSNAVEEDKWRPSMISVSKDSFERYDAFELLRWVSHKYGFGTYVHLIEDYLSYDSKARAKTDLDRLLKIGENSHSNVYFETVVSPAFTSALSQILQFPGISGKENNTILFEYDREQPKGLEEVISQLRLVKTMDFDICILGSSGRGFGYKNEIHIWITPNDYINANFMILMGYIILGHNDWKGAQIKIFAIYEENEFKQTKVNLENLIQTGRLPISSKNIKMVPYKVIDDVKETINRRSSESDLTILGFNEYVDKDNPTQQFVGYPSVGNILFVNTISEKKIV